MIFDRQMWNEDAERAFRPICTDEDKLDEMRLGVDAGTCELWLVDVHSWLCTEIIGNTLWVWTYSGKEFARCAVELAKIALQNNLTHLGWFTFHEFAERSVLKRAPHAKISRTGIPGEWEYLIDAKELSSYDCQNSGPSEHRDRANDQRSSDNNPHHSGTSQECGNSERRLVEFDRTCFGGETAQHRSQTIFGPLGTFLDVDQRSVT